MASSEAGLLALSLMGTATAHLVIGQGGASDGGRSVLTIDGRLPVVPVGELFGAGDRLGVALAVLRTLARLGDDRVVLCEVLDAAGPPVAGAAWVEASLVDTGSASVQAALETGLAEGAAPVDALAWEREGWFADVVAWVDGRLAAIGARRTGAPRQLRHWGLSSVVEVPTDRGPVVVKQVLPALVAEVRVSAWLGVMAPEAVPAVLDVDEASGRFLMEGVTEGGPADDEEAGLSTLAAIQRATRDADRQLLALGVPDRRPSVLLRALHALTTRDDLLLDSGWSLSSTDTRRPPRAVVAADVAGLRRLVGALDPLVRRLEDELPSGTIVHGDFHRGNVLGTTRRPVVIDWGQAALGHPLFDLPAWPDWDRDADARAAPFLSAWGCTATTWELVRPLALAFHAVTAARLADAMPSASRRSDWAAATQKLVLAALGQ